MYESFGFQGMETPAVENISVFLGKGGGENEKLMFQVMKRGPIWHALSNVNVAEGKGSPTWPCGST